MTQDQFMAMIRQLIPFLSGMAVGKGWLTTDQAGTLSVLILQIGGPAFAVASGIWAYIANSKASILQSAGNMPEVKRVVLDSRAPETTSLNNATPSKVSVE